MISSSRKGEGGEEDKKEGKERKGKGEKKERSKELTKERTNLGLSLIWWRLSALDVLWVHSFAVVVLAGRCICRTFVVVVRSRLGVLLPNGRG